MCIYKWNHLGRIHGYIWDVENSWWLLFLRICIIKISNYNQKLFSYKEEKLK